MRRRKRVATFSGGYVNHDRAGSEDGGSEDGGSEVVSD
jgi:hypothetical protein